MIGKRIVTRMVRDALRNLYAPDHLQNHPLINFLNLGHQGGETSGEALRRILRESIERLRPAGESPVEVSLVHGYEVLRLRYIRLLDQEAVCSQLNISPSTYFRRHREALDAVTSLLLEHYQREESEGRTIAPGLVSEEAINRAAALASRAPGEIADLGVLLEEIVRTADTLAAQNSVDIHAEVHGARRTLHSQLPVLRQILMSLIVGSLRCTSGPNLRVTVSSEPGEMVWQLAPLAIARIEQLWDKESTRIACQKLVSLCSASLQLQPENSERVSLTLTVPMPDARIVLVVDDDPAAITLYRRLLRTYDASVIGARSAEEASSVLDRVTPNLVLLDVLLPGEDGWSILRRLNSLPAETRVPVVVCSVIEQPELALALGAVEVLNKPFTPDDLMRIIDRLL